MTYRLQLGGDTDSAKLLIPTARKVLGELNRDMLFNNLGQLQKTVRLASGAIIKVSNIMGLETVNIMFPEVEPVTPQVIEEEYEVVEAFRIQLTNRHDEEIVTTNNLSRIMFFTKDAISFDDEFKVFDYEVPEDVTPEEFFGSGDNPGLDWSDEDECFVVELSSFDDYVAGVPEDDDGYYAVYSCRNDDNESVTEKQQYQNILDNVQRWDIESLISSNSDDDVYIDKISCSGEGYITAEIGNYVVIWDIAARNYAQGIIDDNGFIVYDSDWPMLKADLDDWYSIGASSYSISTASSVSSVGAEDFSACDGTSDCVAITSEDSGASPGSPGNIDWSECSKYNCYEYVNDQWETTIEYDYIGEFFADYAPKYFTAAPYDFLPYVLMASRFTSLNGFDICMSVHTNVHSVYDVFRLGSTPVTQTMSLEQTRNFTIETPWGNCFEGMFYAYQTATFVKDDICEGYIIHACHIYHDNGSLYSFAFPSTKPAQWGMFYGARDTIFGVTYGAMKLIKRNYALSGPNCIAELTYSDYSFTIDAVGTMGNYTPEVFPTVDANDLPGLSCIKEGIINLLETYFDAMGSPQLAYITFKHRRFS